MTDFDVRREWINYGDWLVERVGFHRKGYNRLMKYLHDAPFVSYLPRDDDRIEDGKMLRDDYLAERRIPLYIFDEKYCTVLEMLVALAIRIDNEWIGDPGDPDPGMIFWEMVCNLGLHQYIDQYFDEDMVLQILGVWIKREFYPNGIGSIFPVKFTKRDQRRCEIWKQMQEYICEKYS